jgi:hypothetical protein
LVEDRAGVANGTFIHMDSGCSWNIPIKKLYCVVINMYFYSAGLVMGFIIRGIIKNSWVIVDKP